MLRIGQCRKKQDGYILLTTVFVIAMVTVLTIGLVRHSMNLAISAIESEEKLQEKWGSASILRYGSRKQNELLNRREWDDENDQWRLLPLKRSTAEIVIGGQNYFVCVDDESAKLNINILYESLGSESATKTIKRYVGIGELKVSLAPLNSRFRRGVIEDAFESWGQVFRHDDQLDVAAASLFDATRDLTCWGSELNFKTAGKMAFEDTMKPLIGAANTFRLEQLLRDLDSSRNWEDQLAEIGVREQQQAQVKQRLADHTTCQSVWVTCVTNKRRSDWLMVQESVAGSIVRRHSFTW